MESGSQIQLERYAWCMHSIKNRINFLTRLLAGKEQEVSTGLLVPDVEVGAVQLRKTLELIAMSSITANEVEYKAVQTSFKKQWKASLIVRDIERINPHFYPTPIKWTGENVDFNVHEDYLDKKKFIKLYEWCGSRLHALNPYRNDRDEGVKYKHDLNHIEKSRQQIVRLLNQHRAILSDNETEIWCEMQTNENNKPKAYLVKKILKQRDKNR